VNLKIKKMKIIKQHFWQCQ